MLDETDFFIMCEEQGKLLNYILLNYCEKVTESRNLLVKKYVSHVNFMKKKLQLILNFPLSDPSMRSI